MPVPPVELWSGRRTVGDRQRIEAVGDDAALMIGRIQYADPDRGVTDRSAFWLTVLRDGMLRRTRVFGNTADARAAYAQLREGRESPTSRTE